MQFLNISNTTTLSELNSIVGRNNVDSILNINSLKRTPNIGSQLLQKVNDLINSRDITNTNWQRKLSILNTMTEDSDIYEYAALSDENSWKVISNLNTFPSMLRIPDSVDLPDSYLVLGNNQSVSNQTYNSVVSSLTNDPHIIDPGIFNSYSSITNSKIAEARKVDNPIQWFNLPWGKITLYSSINGESMDFPVYPESLSDEAVANYDTMPDMIYQYEPWYTYQSSGPRTKVYEFHMHRDMWSGNHLDGRCFDLVSFCKAQCYPDYNGAAVSSANNVMYIAGKSDLAGFVTNVQEEWGGPLGQDGWYLELTLKVSMTEVSKSPLNYTSVRNARRTYTI